MKTMLSVAIVMILTPLHSSGCIDGELPRATEDAPAQTATIPTQTRAGADAPDDAPEPTAAEPREDDRPSPPATVDTDHCEAGWDWLTLPIRFHLLKSPVPNLNTSLTPQDIPELIVHTNELWSQACIRFVIEEIYETDAESEGEEAFLAVPANPPKGALAPVLKQLVAPEELLQTGWNVVVIRDFNFPAAGKYDESIDTVFFAQGKMKPTHPTILAHELGHSLGLGHYTGHEVEINIMHAGGSGDVEETDLLTLDQIAIAREQAQTGDAH